MDCSINLHKVEGEKDHYSPFLTPLLEQGRISLLRFLNIKVWKLDITGLATTQLNHKLHDEQVVSINLIIPALY